MYSERLLHFHTIILNLNCFQKYIGINFYCRAPFQLDNYPFDKCGAKRAVDYDVPHASSISDDQVYPCCGLLELEKWNVHHHSCVQMSYGPTDNSYSSLKQLSVIFVIKIVFLQQILFCTKNVYIYVSCIVCLSHVCHFTYITHSCLWMHITEAHGGLENSNFFSLIKILETVLLFYKHMM